MKYSIVLVILLCASFTEAQYINLAASIEQTVQGGFPTGMIGYEFKQRVALGGFYQTKGFFPSDREIQNGQFFYGGYIQIFISSSETVTFSGLLRCGMVNNQFLVMVPSVESRIRMYKCVHVTVGAGYRHGYPAVNGALLIRIKK